MPKQTMLLEKYETAIASTRLGLGESALKDKILNKEILIMAWIFSLSAECGSSESDAERFAKHFNQIYWQLPNI